MPVVLQVLAGRGEVDRLKPRFRSMEERFLGVQQDSWPSASRARQMQPRAANLSA